VNNNRVKNFLIVLVTLLVACERAPTAALTDDSAQAVAQSNNAAIVDAFKRKKSDIFVEGTGVVKKLLADDNRGSRHQKFLVSISPEQTLLFAHNIDLASRLDALAVGDAVSFRGEYVYNPKGGVMHWTHHDPDGKQQGGWIKHNGKIYE
jgi:Protein of unknown function (DUF3465)